jgi:hypothetical protein
MFLKNCCLDGISFLVCWTCITCVSLKSRERCLHYMKLNQFIPIWKILILCLPSHSGGSSRPLVPSTLVFILVRSSLVKSPFHILFSIWPYSGSSLKQCSLSKMITALMQFSQCWLDKLKNRSSVSLAPTGSSWWKSPANIIVNPPKGRLQFPNSFSFLSSVLRIVSLMNDTLSITTIRTSCHSFLLSIHCHEQELNCLDNTLFVISFISCVTGIHKGQPLGGFTLFFTPPYTFCTKFIFADVDVIKRTGVINVDSWLFDFC